MLRQLHRLPKVPHSQTNFINKMVGKPKTKPRKQGLVLQEMSTLRESSEGVTWGWDWGARGSSLSGGCCLKSSRDWGGGKPPRVLPFVRGVIFSLPGPRVSECMQNACSSIFAGRVHQTLSL